MPRLHHPSKPKPGLPGTPASGAFLFFHLTHGDPPQHAKTARAGTPDAVGYPVVAPTALGICAAKPGSRQAQFWLDTIESLVSTTEIARIFNLRAGSPAAELSVAAEEPAAPELPVEPGGG